MCDYSLQSIRSRPAKIGDKLVTRHPHVFGDADRYMDEGEKKAAMEKDPVPRFRKKTESCAV